MIKEELVAGLKNAIERGADIERAKYSFISAGYSREEVEEAANSIRSGSVLSQEKELQIPVTPSYSPKLSRPTRIAEGSIKNKIRLNLKIILLVVVLIVLVGILIVTLLFREDILAWIA